MRGAREGHRSPPPTGGAAVSGGRATGHGLRLRRGAACAVAALLGPRAAEPLEGVRVGEAQLPGPRPAGQQQVAALMASVTRWRASWKGPPAADADVCRAQEARIPAVTADSAVAGAPARGTRLLPGTATGGEHMLATAHRAQERAQICRCGCLAGARVACSISCCTRGEAEQLIS